MICDYIFVISGPLAHRGSISEVIEARSDLPTFTFATVSVTATAIAATHLMPPVPGAARAILCSSNACGAGQPGWPTFRQKLRRSSGCACYSARRFY